MAHPAAGSAHNPFAAFRVEPGAIPYLAPDGFLDGLWTRLERHAMRGQIMGPHGSGKSALLAHMAGMARARGIATVEARAPLTNGGLPLPPRGGILFLDSAEAVSPLAWLRLRVRCAAVGAGLVVTTHRDLGLPLLHRQSAELTTARAVVERLLEGWDVERPSDAALASMLERGASNLRLVLFELYDWYEDLSVPAT